MKTYYIVVVENQAEGFEEHTAFICDVAYDNIEDAILKFNQCVSEIENDTEFSWVAESLENPIVTVRKKIMFGGRWIEYKDMYSSSRMYAYIKEIKIQ